MPTFKNIHFVINPAAGQPEPVLHIINKILYEHDIAWDVSITREDGDGKRLTREAIDNGTNLIVAYGGDGTVKDVVNGLLDSDVPLALLHGGTGNAMAHELDIPKSLEQAVQLIASEHNLRGVDIGKVSCTSDTDKTGYFLLRMSMGLQTKILETASRDMKTRYGNFAYLMASLQELKDSENVNYSLTIDDEKVEGQGLTALIANSAFIGGQADMSFAPKVNPSDGQLDVLIMDNSFMSAMQMIGSALEIDGANFERHWRGKNITIHAPEDQLITLDGEVFGRTPAQVEILPDAVQIVVPKKKQ